LRSPFSIIFFFSVNDAHLRSINVIIPFARYTDPYWLYRNSDKDPACFSESFL
jgi:hypothetical protein